MLTETGELTKLTYEIYFMVTVSILTLGLTLPWTTQLLEKSERLFFTSREDAMHFVGCIVAGSFLWPVVVFILIFVFIMYCFNKVGRAITSGMVHFLFNDHIEKR